MKKLTYGKERAARQNGANAARAQSIDPALGTA
jgi:hypothetical protein